MIFVITVCHLRVWYRPSSNPVMTGRPRCDDAARPPVCSKFSLANLWLEAASVDGLRTNAWDVSFLGIDPDRIKQVDFSHPLFQSDMTYLVAPGSPIQSVADADQTGIRIAVPKGDQSDLYLSRTLIRAKLIRTDSHAAAVDLLRTRGADAKASPRYVLMAELPAVPGARVLDEGFADHPFAAIAPKGHAARLAYVNEFVEQAKASGLAKRIIDSLGLKGVVRVAPPKS